MKLTKCYWEFPAPNQTLGLAVAVGKNQSQIQSKTCISYRKLHIDKQAHLQQKLLRGSPNFDQPFIEIE